VDPIFKKKKKNYDLDLYHYCTFVNNRAPVLNHIDIMRFNTYFDNLLSYTYIDNTVLSNQIQ